MNKENYIAIQSKGEIPVDSFTLLGNSTKRDNDDLIGRFGSGLKYSIARLLEMGVTFRVFAGENEIEFSTKEKEFRGELFNVIFINGKETNFTTEMGPDWGAYDCIREIYANAVDEGLLHFGEADNINHSDSVSTFYVEKTKEVADIVDRFTHYFSFFREDAIYETERLTIYPSNGHLILYKDGFKVFEDENRKSAFHYDYPQAKINESRVIDSLYSTSNAIATEIVANPTDDLIRRFKELMKLENYDPDLWEMNMDWWVLRSANDKWKNAFENKTIVSADSLSFYEDFAKGMKECYVAPKNLGKEIRRTSDKIRMLGGDSSDKSNSYLPAKTNPEVRHPKITEALNILEDAGLTIPYDIITAEFEYDSVLGTVDDGNIVVSITALEKRSARFIAEIIYEEYAHLESRQSDNTRGFQNYLIREVMKYMKLYSDLKKKMEAE